MRLEKSYCHLLYIVKCIVKIRELTPSLCCVTLSSSRQSPTPTLWYISMGTHEVWVWLGCVSKMLTEYIYIVELSSTPLLTQMARISAHFETASTQQQQSKSKQCMNHSKTIYWHTKWSHMMWKLSNQLDLINAKRCRVCFMCVMIRSLTRS